MEYLRLCVFNFLVYSFFGWIIEGLFNLITKGSFLKPNFLRLPLKPMYGFASTIILLLYPVVPWPLFLISIFFIPSLIEYASAAYLHYFFNLEYWDYSHKAHHINGYVCLEFSFYWVILSLILIYFIEPLIDSFYNWFLPVWSFSYLLALFIVIIDFILVSLHYQGIKQKRI